MNLNKYLDSIQTPEKYTPTKFEIQSPNNELKQ